MHLGKSKTQIHLPNDALRYCLQLEKVQLSQQSCNHLPDFTVNEPSFLSAPQKGRNGNASHYNWSTNAFTEIWEDPESPQSLLACIKNAQMSFLFNSKFLIFFIIFPSTKRALCVWISLNVYVSKDKEVWKMWLNFLTNSYYKTWPWKWKANEIPLSSKFSFMSKVSLAYSTT